MFGCPETSHLKAIGKQYIAIWSDVVTGAGRSKSDCRSVRWTATDKGYVGAPVCAAVLEIHLGRFDRIGT